MKILEIHDMTSKNFLAFDLIEVMEALGSSADSSYWKVCKAEPWENIFFIEATGEGASELEQLGSGPINLV